MQEQLGEKLLFAGEKKLIVSPTLVIAYNP